MTNPDDIKAAIRRDIGRRVKHHRKAAGLSQTELALHIGTQSGEVSRWETGQRRPSPDNIALIADALDVDWRILEYGTLDEADE